jgi:hypothetical protein
MPSIQRALLGVAALSLLAACNFYGTTSEATSAGDSGSGAATATITSSGGSGVTGFATSTGTSPPPPADSVNATPSVAGTVSVIPGAQQTITVAFTTADGRPISGLGLSNTTLPADWSGPNNFTCSVTSSGNDCVLTLTYAPTATETGTLGIGYVYAGDANSPPLVTLSIPYAATTSNNIVATPMPIGQITAASGTGAQSVSVNFTTDDGNAATGLTMLSDLSSLPAGWSTTTPGFSCAIISNGSGCQLVLNYVPKTAGSGTLTLSYGYTDHSGAARTSALNLPYSTTVNGNVVAMVSPTGQINAIQKTGTQGVTVTFTTDDGQSASGLSLLSPLSALPAGWSSAVSDFTCGTISTGNGCQLALSYAPTALTSGTVQLEYGYTGPGGTFTTGFLNVPYAATTNDNLVATAAPSGRIDAIVGELNPEVLVTFTTDDTRTATSLQLTTDLATLPSGWTSSESSFSCAGVGSGTTCQLPFTYTPTAAASGTLTLRYSYLNNAGESKSGSLNIPYRATTDDSILGTVNPASLAVVTGTSTALTVSFATDDGNPASALSVTSGLTGLPAGWSSAASSFGCSSVSAGTNCLLTLTYAPGSAASGTLTLAYTYLNDSGEAKTGTVSIPYRATTNDSIIGTPNPTSLTVVTGTSNTLTVSFATDDGNPASALSVISGLTALPAGWSSAASSFACSSVSAGGSCQLTLTYQPTNPGSGTLAFGFTYTNDSGSMKTGTVSIPYAATP